jgi:hypothetical protein
VCIVFCLGWDFVFINWIYLFFFFCLYKLFCLFTFMSFPLYLTLANSVYLIGNILERLSFQNTLLLTKTNERLTKFNIADIHILTSYQRPRLSWCNWLHSWLTNMPGTYSIKVSLTYKTWSDIYIWSLFVDFGVFLFISL